MKTYATYFQNSKESPVCYGEINLINPPRQRLRGEEKKPRVSLFPDSHDMIKTGRFPGPLPDRAAKEEI